MYCRARKVQNSTLLPWFWFCCFPKSDLVRSFSSGDMCTLTWRKGKQDGERWEHVIWMEEDRTCAKALGQEDAGSLWGAASQSEEWSKGNGWHMRGRREGQRKRRRGLEGGKREWGKREERREKGRKEGNNKRWQQCGEIETLVYCWGDCKIE